MKFNFQKLFCCFPCCRQENDSDEEQIIKTNEKEQELVWRPNSINNQKVVDQLEASEDPKQHPLLTPDVEPNQTEQKNQLNEEILDQINA